MQDDEASFLDALYLGVRDGTDFDKALTLLCRMFEVPSGALLDFDATRPEISAQAAVGIFSGDVMRRYEQEFASLDPAPLAFMKQRVGTAASTYRLLADEMKRPGVFFGEFFRPLGLEECLGGTLASSNGRFALIGLQRGPDRAVFDDADIARLERLMPHLWRALQLRRSFLSLDLRTSGLAEICDRSAAGLVGIDDEARSLFVNAAMRDMAAAEDGIALDRRGFPVVLDRGAGRRIAELMQDVRNGGAGGVVRVARLSGKAPYVMMVAPLFLEGGADTGRTRAKGTLLIVHDPLRRAAAAPELIAAMLGLPLGSAKMLAALAAGEDLKDYADKAGISMNTVRFHLKSAYARTGVHSQSQLVRLAVAALRDIADHRD